MEDLPAVDDADLTVHRSEIAPGNNGFDHLVEAARALDWPEEADERLQAIRDGAIVDREWVDQMLTRNKGALERMQRGIAAAEFAFPRHRAGELDDGSETLIAVQRLVKLSGARSRLDSEGGTHEEAIERALLGLRVSHRISRAEGITLTGMMFALVYSGLGVNDLSGAVRGATITRDQARDLIDELEATRLAAADWQRMWAVEYEVMRTGLTEAMEGPEDLEGESWIWRIVPRSYLWQPRRTANSLAQIHRERQWRSAQSCRIAHADSANQETGQKLRVAKTLISPNPVGGIILEVARSLDRFDTRRCHVESKLSLLEALIAIEAYAGEHGDLPSRLEALVPDYLDRVPDDRFAGAPLRYSRERKALWSVGEDLVDAGGGEKLDLGNAAEPGISLAL